MRALWTVFTIYISLGYCDGMVIVNKFMIVKKIILLAIKQGLCELTIILSRSLFFSNQ